MKADLITTMQIIFALIFLVGVITYTITSAKNCIKRFNYHYIKSLHTKSLNYSRFMTIDNYISYEKYDIWRYCVHF
ncbi:MAG: hypothetical protein AB6733_19940 [Clostridiaceae bacterium]